MEITDVIVKKVETTGKMKAVAHVTFDNSFVVHDIKVIEGAEGPFIAMPSRKPPKGDWKDIAHPINQETRAYITKKILDEYERVLREEPSEGSTEE